MNDTTQPEQLDLYTTVHAYVSLEVPNWRTCALCGSGANARIHRIKSAR